MKPSTLLPLFACVATTVLGQGSLTPPGAPAPTMKTLDQVEPRTPIGTSTTPGDANSLFRIAQPGSYYLTNNITGVAAKHGIEIAASGVTLDLTGFELVGGVSNSLDGVNVSTSVTNLAVRNGSVRNWGGDGVDAILAANGQYLDLRLSANKGAGLRCGSSSLVTRCNATANTGDGIDASAYATVTSCTATRNAGDGIATSSSSIVTGCTASFNTNNGISVAFGSTVSGCSTFRSSNGIVATVGCIISSSTAYSHISNGIVATYSSTISGCTAYRNGSDSIKVDGDCRIVDNHCVNAIIGADSAGIHATGSNNRIESNLVSFHNRGIDVDSPGNFIIRNTANGNTINYAIAINNVLGPILDRTVPASPAVSGSSAPSSLGTTEANANFSF